MDEEKAWKIILEETQKEIDRLGKNLEDISNGSSFVGYHSEMSEEEVYQELGRLCARTTCPVAIENISFYDTIIQKYDTLSHFIESKDIKKYTEFMKKMTEQKKEAMEDYLNLDEE